MYRKIPKPININSLNKLEDINCYLDGVIIQVIFPGKKLNYKGNSLDKSACGTSTNYVSERLIWMETIYR